MEQTLHANYDEELLERLGGLMNKSAVQVRDPYFYFTAPFVSRLWDRQATG
ncbi:MAG: hypothetical protein KDB14_23940 [Planctomycetales bacterium]|nr:hypothetical protein [Planctomycetales bacterium]